jgi:hypothetical protein
MKLQQSFFQASLLAALLSGTALARAGEETAPAQAVTLAAAPAPEAQPAVDPAKSESAPAAAVTASGGMDGSLIALGLAAALLIFAFIPKGGKQAPAASSSSKSASSEPAGDVAEPEQTVVAEAAETEEAAAAEPEEQPVDEAAAESEQASSEGAEAKA